jgi:formylglycine-generating enzyme required for sulfatase activity
MRCTRLLPWMSLAAVACGEPPQEARDQWLVSIATDAPLPQFGDRLLVDILDDGGALACDECRRLFDARPETFPTSFGVAGAPRATHVRARLYRSADVGADGLPQGTALIDALGRLPSPTGVTAVWLPLWAACFGVPADIRGDMTCEPAGRMLHAISALGSTPDSWPKVGSWAPAREIPCPEAAPAGMTCVPGGVFIMGATTPLRTGEVAEAPPHVVRLDPFAIDTDEVTLGTVIPLLRAGSVVGSPIMHANQPVFDSSAPEGCTFVSLLDRTRDALPADCLGWETADSICKALGKRLPTEAEWEYVATNAPAGDHYPWGDEDDVCARAYVARGALDDGSLACHDAMTAANKGPVAGGMASDVSRRGVHNLAGNVAEWVADDLAAYDAPCWREGPFPLANPLCVTGSDAPDREKVFRGGFWSGSPFTARSVVRQGSRRDIPMIVAGVRCALSWPASR